MGKKSKARGKAPNGRAKQRGKAPRQPPGGQRERTSYLDGDGDEPYVSFRGFAQRAPPSSSPRNPDVKLRHQAIAFVSAGTNMPAPESAEEGAKPEPDEDEDVDGAEAGDDPEDDDPVEINIAGDTDVEIIESTAHMNINGSSPLFVVDTEGDAALISQNGGISKTAVPVRTPSPALSDSSSEEVVFSGRGVPARGGESKPSQAPHPVQTFPCSEDKANGGASHPAVSPQRPHQISSSSLRPALSYASLRNDELRSDVHLPPVETAEHVAEPPREAEVKQSKSDDGAEQTIAALQEEVRASRREKKKKKAQAAADAELENSELETKDASSKGARRRKRGRKKDNRRLKAPVMSDDEDVNEAAYNDYLANLAAQNMVSVLTVGDGGSDNGPSLVINGQRIEDNEVLDDNLQLDADESSSDEVVDENLSETSDDEPPSDLESSDLEEELFYAEQEQWEDEEDLRQRRQDAMSDEQLAHLLAKQQELGIDAEDLIIDDGIFGDDDDDDEGIGDLLEARTGLSSIANSSFGGRKNKRKTRTSRGRDNSGFSFPDASALADAVEQFGENGFDVMDFDRPSLRDTKKGRKSKAPAELDGLSDEELKEGIRETWENDRAKKRLKKAEREELRAQGLLGATGKKGKADLGQKYLQGMTMSEVHEELRIFMRDDGQSSRPFPPMEKGDRKALHDIANMLNLKSKSVGSGKGRFPVVYKTRHTAYSEAHFNKALAISSRSFLRNAKYGGGNQPRPARAGRGGGFNKAAVSLRNGEVVGANAAEIGQDSIGHRLMEKMGWSKGMALGKDGEGLLVPVAQVMRSGKAGLG